jgi:cytochrome c oxidase assembly protein subunit 15
MTADKKISLWLFISAAAVFLMAVIGAITRLTESGLSITEWKPVTGALPPLNEAGWLAEFDLYKQSPQYLKVNHGMSLEEFKNIFFWEWLHRLWGRMIGLIYFIPLMFFWRHIEKQHRPAMVGILVLGFLQGAMGWYMVQSGLTDNPAVSHYRLAAHLMLAAVIYLCLLYMAFAFQRNMAEQDRKILPLRKFTQAALALALVTMTWGAFVAGLDAGMVYNTFPKMDAHWIPPEMMQHSPVWKSFFEEPATVQFTHRFLAIALFIKILLLSLRGFRAASLRRTKNLFMGLAAVIILQTCLGVLTLLTQVNIMAATLHQAGAMAAVFVLAWLLFETRKGKAA